MFFDSAAKAATGATTMIHVIAAVEVAAGRSEAVLAEFRRLVPLVRAEAGCLEYSPSIDVSSGLPLQIPLRESVITVVERWESLAALHAHLQSPHMREFRERVKGMVSRIQLQVLQPA
jgi:quinol monooxygenase YgiN